MKIVYNSTVGNGENAIDLIAEITLIKCPEDPKQWREIFHICPIAHQCAIVSLEMICGCDCENRFEMSSPKCNNHGTYKCGICECDSFTSGRRCECSTAGLNVMSQCSPDNSSVVCSGRGHCVCDICECERRTNPEEIISGKYCECDNFSCERLNGLVCGGPQHGSCECGVCNCKPGWTGADCSCRDSIETCVPPNGREICSGNGECICGACKCESLAEGRYSGRFCEKCPTCTGRCQELKECVQCQMYKTGPLTLDNCIQNCTFFVPIPVEKVEADDESGDSLCIFYDENDCRYQFIYNDNGHLVVKAQENLECPLKFSIFNSIGSLVPFGSSISNYFNSSSKS